MSFIDDVKNLDPNSPGEWPFLIQLIVCAIIMAIILFLGWNYDIKGLREDIGKQETKEVELKDTFETKQRKAANLDALKDQMMEMEQSFGEMLRQLPNKTEVDALIVDISQTGLAAGLEFDLFRPGDERPSEFYSEFPISIAVRGNYHQLGEFISGIASLPRIVTTHDIKINKAQGSLTLAATAKTYRALDEEEEAPKKGKKRGKKGGKKK